MVGDVIEVSTEKLAYGGDAIARHEGLAIFIPMAAPGERLRVRITERKKNMARAEIEQIITRSGSRRVPPCAYFGECGGCQLQHIDYAAQMEAKVGFIRDALSRIGKIDWPGEIEISSGAEFGYRARAQVKLEFDGGNRYAKIGFNRKASHSVLDVDSCPVLVPELNSALTSLRASLKPWPHTSSRGNETGPSAEIEIAAGEAGAGSEPQLPGFAGGTLTTRVGENVYRFSPTTFFQSNRPLIEQMVSEVAGSERGALALDLYAGVGLFTIPLARRFGKVIGVESDARAARFAVENISANDLSNVEFHNLRTDVWLKRVTALRGSKRLRAPDLAVLDPPRGGAAEAVAHLAALGPRAITYVSCDPTTLARDLRRLLDSGYKLTAVKGFDLFPQTYHVETIAWLNLK